MFDNYMLRASDNAIYWCVPEEFINEMMPHVAIRTVLICNGYLVFVTPKKFVSQTPKEYLN